jgi:O-antigen ligase
VLGLMLRRPMKIWRVCVGLAIAIPMWIAIVYSGSRGGLVSMLGQVLFIALLVFIANPFAHAPGRQLQKESRLERARRIGPFLVTRVVLIGFVLVVMMVGIVWIGGDPLALHLESMSNEFGVKDSDKYVRTYRSTIWPMTWQMIKDHPIAGTGFGGYWIAITKYHQGSGEMTPQQAHNDYLELLAGGGFIGMAIGLWFVGNCARQLFERFRAADPVLRASCLGALAGIFAVAAHSFVDFGLHITVNALVFIMLIVIATLSPTFMAKAETAKNI